MHRNLSHCRLAGSSLGTETLKACSSTASSLDILGVRSTQRGKPGCSCPFVCSCPPTRALASHSSNTDNTHSGYTFMKHLLCARCWRRCFSYFILLNLHDDEGRQAVFFFFIQAVQKRKRRHRGINNEQLTQGVRQVYLGPSLNHYILFFLKLCHQLNRQF